MLTRFDHVAIAVRDLDVAMQRYRALGFAVSSGGQHLGHGTQNAIIRFGLDYLELLAVSNVQEARSSGLNAVDLLDFLERHPGGLLGYALASDDLAGDVARLRSFGLPVEGPFGMRRERPDGSVLAWQLAIPGGAPWRRPWPFLIAWETPDAERLVSEPPAEQPNGVQGVVGLAVAVWDLDAAIALYQQGLGLTPSERQPYTDLAAERAQFRVGRTRLDLLAPYDGNDDGLVAQALRAEGEGVFRVELATSDLEPTRRAFAAGSVPLSSLPGEGDELLVAPEGAEGARLLVRPANPGMPRESG